MREVREDGEKTLLRDKYEIGKDLWNILLWKAGWWFSIGMSVLAIADLVLSRDADDYFVGILIATVAMYALYARGRIASGAVRKPIAVLEWERKEFF